MSGHLGIKKTQDHIKALTNEIRRYCKSCSIWQKTFKKGCRGAPVPLQKRPLIHVPFKRIAIDFSGPIN